MVSSSISSHAILQQLARDVALRFSTAPPPNPFETGSLLSKLLSTLCLPAVPRKRSPHSAYARPTTS